MTRRFVSGWKGTESSTPSLTAMVSLSRAVQIRQTQQAALSVSCLSINYLFLFRGLPRQKHFVASLASLPCTLPLILVPQPPPMPSAGAVVLPYHPLARLQPHTPAARLISPWHQGMSQCFDFHNNFFNKDPHVQASRSCSVHYALPWIVVSMRVQAGQLPDTVGAVHCIPQHVLHFLCAVPSL